MLLGSNRGVRTNLAALERPRHSIVSLRYSAPVHIDAGNFADLMLMMTCADGSARAAQGRHKVEWQRGQTLPFSPNVRSHLVFERDFCQHSVRLDINAMEALCARLLNRALDKPLRFEFRTFSPALTSVALANGFPHLARFAGYYRAAFDEYPSETLGRSRRRGRG